MSRAALDSWTPESSPIRFLPDPATATRAAASKVRQVVTRMGYPLTRRQGGRLGQPEVVVAGLRKLIFVYSCVAHGHIHPGCDLSAPPAVPSEAWMAWRTRTRDRDRRRFARLRARGWSVLVLWECQLTRAVVLRRQVRDFLLRTEPDR